MARLTACRLATLLAVFSLVPAPAQQSLEDFKVYTDHPRLLLTKQRLRLLKRERERQSARWQQFQALIEGKAVMPEPGFALALYYQTTGNATYGAQAIQWASAHRDETRQFSLVYDWCYPLLTEAQRKEFAETLRPRLEHSGEAAAVPAFRDLAFAAFAAADESPGLSARALFAIVQSWRRSIDPALQAGKPVIRRAQNYALLELLHAMRDNFTLDLREGDRSYFAGLPALQLLTYYPDVYTGPENAYHIPVQTSGEPDLNEAALSRAAEFSMVAYDNNAVENQFLQGWLMDDHFALRNPFGAPYEFLWANPYQPGLSYYKSPLFYHNEESGELYVRANWEDDSKWAGLTGGKLQIFADGKRREGLPTALPSPVTLGTAVVLHPVLAHRTLLSDDPVQHYFAVGLKPKHVYQLEIDDEEMRELTSDTAGTVEFTAQPREGAGFLLRDPA